MAGGNVCPVCGWDELEEPPYNSYGNASFEICPCCGTEFGYSDATTSHDELRRRWLDSGAVWQAPSRTPPPGWNAVAQLSRAGLLPK